MFLSVGVVSTEHMFLLVGVVSTEQCLHLNVSLAVIITSATRLCVVISVLCLNVYNV